MAQSNCGRGGRMAPPGSTKEWVRKQVSCQDFVITIREGRHQFSWHKKQEQSRISPSDTVVVLTQPPRNRRAPPFGDPSGRECQYLLDGQQRTTALMTAIHGGRIKGQEDHDPQLYVNLTTPEVPSPRTSCGGSDSYFVTKLTYGQSGRKPSPKA